MHAAMKTAKAACSRSRKGSSCALISKGTTVSSVVTISTMRALLRTDRASVCLSVETGTDVDDVVMEVDDTGWRFLG